MFAAVDDVADARDCEGGFGDVGGEDDFASVFRGGGEEDAVLKGLWEGGEEREGEDLVVWVSLGWMRGS